MHGMAHPINHVGGVVVAAAWLEFEPVYLGLQADLSFRIVLYNPP